MNQFPSDEELLAQLRETFPPSSVSPDELARQRLLDALALDNVVSVDAYASRSSRLRRRFSSHASALTLSAVGVLALGGVAAAAVATNTLPGPTRAIAYDLGLPVTSPALVQARSQLHQLVTANSSNLPSSAREIGRQLISDLKKLNHSDLAQISTAARSALAPTGLLSQATRILGSLSVVDTTTTTVAPSTTTSTSNPTTTTTSVVPLTVPGVGSISGITNSTGVGGVLKNTTSTVTSLLP